MIAPIFRLEERAVVDPSSVAALVREEFVNSPAQKTLEAINSTIRTNQEGINAYADRAGTEVAQLMSQLGVDPETAFKVVAALKHHATAQGKTEEQQKEEDKKSKEKLQIPVGITDKYAIAEELATLRGMTVVSQEQRDAVNQAIQQLYPQLEAARIELNVLQQRAAQDTALIAQEREARLLGGTSVDQKERVPFSETLARIKQIHQDALAA